jgi:hypothetical protein
MPDDNKVQVDVVIFRSCHIQHGFVAFEYHRGVCILATA